MSLGGSIKLKGESEYQQALSNITSKLSLLTSEMKVVTSQFDKNDKSVANLTGQNQVLTKQIAEQKEKVATLTKALADAKAETGDNSATTIKWQKALNNAQADLNKMELNLKNNEKAIKDFGKEEDNAKEKTFSLGDVIKANLTSEAIISGIKGLASAVKQVGAAFVDLGKQSLQAYADFEQLKGGIDTLFGDSSQTVMNFANNAFMTTGLSANQYMEQVTSFSASLLQSLGGDTEKAANVADMALTDMADNANKMGTSMESIQSAYQGFAKGQYQLLDNLKLGYGGTKGEMERLLADAEKISGVKYDITNLNDVYQAIHVIQGELGITGATSKEASTTIQGSTAAMKAAWSNLLTGIADDNANFSGLIDNFVNSISNVATNIMPRVEIIIDGIIQLVMTLADRLLANSDVIIESGMGLVQKIIDGIVGMSPSLAGVASQLLNTLVAAIISNLPQVINAGINILLTLVGALGQQLPTLIPVAVDAIVTLTTGLIDNIDTLVDAGIDLILGLADGLIYAIPNLIEKAPIILDKLVSALAANLPKLVNAGGQLIGKLVVGVIGALGQLVATAPKIIGSILSGITQWWSTVMNLGTNLVQGIWEGISSSLDWIKNKISGWVGNVLKFIKKLFGINSPSKVMKEQIGTNLALGIGEGFEETMDKVSDNMASAIPTNFDIDTTSSGGSGDSLANALKVALQGVKVVMNDREMGTFVIDTVGKVVYQ